MKPAFLLAALALSFASSAALAQTPPETPKLVVAISVDQFSGNLFDEWRGRYKYGLKRLAGGIAYTSAYQSHANTETCPGHSTLLTGTRPNKTGIVANDVRDPEKGEMVYCLLDPSVALAHDPKARPVGPARLMTSTLGEWLKASSPQSRVVSVSGKDRGAIPMAGHNPDGVFWVFPGYGFTTYIRPGQDAAKALEPLAKVNADQADVWKAAPSWTYTSRECKALESTWTLGGNVWNFRLPPPAFAEAKAQVDINNAVIRSPVLDDLTLKAARQLIRHYKLGQGPATDLLTVSFSSNDYVGHRYGSRGPEMCEQQHRLDRTIGILLSDLDKLKIPYMVVLSADHGGSDFTERMAARGYPEAVRVDSGAILKRINARLVAEFKLPSDPLTGGVDEMFFAAAVPAADRPAIARSAIRLLEAEPTVAASFTIDDLLATPIPKGTPPDEFTVKQRFAASTYRGRSGDIVAALKPGATTYGTSLTGSIAGHGSPWNYDRRVPILFWWKGAPRQDRFLPIETVDIAPTLAAVLGLTPPVNIDGRALSLGGQ